MADAVAPAAPSTRTLLICLGLVLLNLLLHINGFLVPHAEGDEMAYYFLAQEMNWDLSHYTTMDHPLIRTYPWTIYQKPLFIHPPLYPLVLKAGIALGNVVLVGLLFNALVMGLAFFAAWRAANRLALGDGARMACFALLAACPILLFSTTHLHHDALLGLLLFAGLTFLIEALETRSLRWTAAAAVTLVLAYNTRFNALVTLPAVFAVPLWHAGRKARIEGRPFGAACKDRSCLMVTGIVWALVLTAGLQHFYRLLAVYGTLMPFELTAPIPERIAQNEFLKQVLARGRGRMLVYLLMLYPAWLLIASPDSWKGLAAAWKERSWRLVYAAGALYLLLMAFVFVPEQMRYYAPALPFAHLVVAFAVEARPASGARRVGWAAIGLSLLLMSASAVAATLYHPDAADVVPAPFVLFEALQPYYR